jgi:hypothetical protein
MTVNTVSYAFDENSDGLVVAHSQDIPVAWTDWLARKRQEAWNLRHNTEHIHVASVPAIFVHKWLKEGFNAYVEPIKEVVKRLHREGLEDFLATDRRAV